MTSTSRAYRSGVKLFALILLLAVMSGCQSVRDSSDEPKVGSKPWPRPPVPEPSAPQPPVEPEPPAAQPQAPTAEHSEEGEASWYGGPLDGEKTASGDTFDAEAFTAAHNSLPFGTRVRVTNVETGKHVDVIINDRGPYVDGRIIDLSQASGEALDIKKDGTQQVRIEVLESSE